MASAHLKPVGLSGKVRLLDSHTVNQIAAGEVVDRPAAAVKELVENALDAGATRVDVEVLDAGRRLIRVADDGSGMGEDDARSALLRHATSKIGSADDLLRVASFGFRGEALPSIASVSRLTLSTGQADGVRRVLVVEEGRTTVDSAESGPRGTTVIVEDLFLCVPARLKFLKSDTTEVGAVADVVGRAAVARPDVAFRLTHEGNVVLQTPGSGGLLDAVAAVWGRDAARGLVTVDAYNGHARVWGLVSPPHFTKPTRSHQWLFVNGRPVRSRLGTAALDQAFRSLTPDKRYPLAVLMVEVDPAQIDVNVSPSKSEVKFHQEGAVFDAVRRAVKDAVLASGAVPSFEGLAAANAALSGESPAMLPPLFQVAFGEGLAAAPMLEVPPTATPDSFVDGLRVLGQIEDTFIIAENRTSLLVVDQHVAHERILYEKIRDTRGAGAVETQRLLEPETLVVGRRTLEAITPRLDELREIGFDVEPFGTETLLVRALPALGRFRPPLVALKDLVDEMADAPPSALTPTRDDVYILASCKLAVKAGDPLGQAEMTRLLLDLARTENPYLCPHGRPITVVFPKDALARKFKR